MSRRHRRPKKSPGNISKHERMKTITARPGIQFPCPFCPGKVSMPEPRPAEENPRFGEAPPEPAIFHTMPPCRQLKEMDMFEFLKAAREKLEATAVPPGVTLPEGGPK